MTKETKNRLGIIGAVALVTGLVFMFAKNVKNVASFVQTHIIPGKFFTWVEFMRSATAAAYDIKEQYYPPLEAFQNAVVLCSWVLTPLRELSGYPIQINSWFRSQELTNKLIDLGYAASPNSRHIRGDVVDIEQFINGQQENGRLALICVQQDLPFDRMIIEHGTDLDPGKIHLEVDASKSINEQNQTILRMTENSPNGLETWSKQKVIELYS